MFFGSFDDTFILLSGYGKCLLELKISFKLFGNVSRSFNSLIFDFFFLFLGFGLILGCLVLRLCFNIITIFLLICFLIILAFLLAVFGFLRVFFFLLLLIFRDSLFNFFSIGLYDIFGVKILNSLKPDNLKWVYFEGKAQLVVTFINIFY